MLVFLAALAWKCLHSERQRMADLRMNSPNLAAGSIEVTYASESTEKTQPIRIYFDLSYLNGSDPYRCRKVGEKIVWGPNTGGVICKEDDIITPSKMEGIKMITDNIAEYFNHLLKVRPLKSIKPNSNDKDDPMPDKTFYDIDLYVVLYGRPFIPGTAQASAASYYADRREPRPKVVTIDFKLGKMTNVAHIYTEGDQRHPFNLITHELLHGLGISSAYFNLWINPKTNQPYLYEDITTRPQVMYNCSFPERGIKREAWFVSTPSIRKFVKERYGNDEFFTPTCQAGIEMEDDGPEGSRLTHLEARVYPNENMNASPKPDAIISEITLALLEATGYYEVNMSLAEPLTFGTAITNKGVPMKDFITGIPLVDWPQNYQCNFIGTFTSTRMCTPDKKSISFDECYRHEHNCPNFISEVCDDLPFFDPYNTGYVGTDDWNDWMMSPWRGRLCTIDETLSVTRRGATPGKNAMCFDATLSKTNENDMTRPRCYTIECKDDYFTVKIGSMTAECHKENEVLTFPDSIYKYGNLTCPDPVDICKLWRQPGKPDFKKIFAEGKVDKTPTLTPNVQIPTKPIVQSFEQPKTNPIQISPNEGPDNSGKNDPKKGSNKTAAVIGSVVAVIVVVVVTVAVIVLLIRKGTICKQRESSDPVGGLSFTI